MLHILLFILKIACIILAVILGILVLLVCIVLFAPMRYEVSGKCDGNLDTSKLKITVTWILHLFRFDMYFKNRILKWRFRIAWRKRVGGQEVSEEKMPKETEKEEKKAEKNESQHKKTQENLEIEEKVPEKSKESSKEPGTSEKNDDKKNIGGKIRQLIQKKKKLQEFLTDEIHIGAFKKIKKEVFRFLRKLNPKVVQTDILFGFDDPCTTGQVLAGLSILYPVIGKHMNITPDFEHKILKGTVYVKGKIRMSTVAVLLWNLTWDRNIRMTYKDIKDFEL